MSTKANMQKTPKGPYFNSPEVRLREYKIRFSHMRTALEGLAERAAKPADVGMLELNLRLWDAFRNNNASEMTRLVRAGARVRSIEARINEDERSLKPEAP